MEVGTGAAAGIAQQCNGLPPLDFFIALFKQFDTMPVAGNHTVAMIDDDRVPEESFFSGKGYNAISGGQNRCSLACGNIIGFMKFAPTGKRRLAIPESGGHPGLHTPGHRTDCGGGCQKVLLILVTP